MGRFSVNFKDDTKEKIDAAGSSLAPGFYRVKVDDTYEDQTNQAQVFKYQICYGPHDGKFVFDRLFSPENADTDDKRQKLLTRVKFYVSRLGIVKTEDFGVDQEKDFDDEFVACIGNEYVVKTISEEYPPKSGKFQAKVDWSGLFPLDSDKIPADERKKLGLPTLKVHEEEAAAAASGGKKRGGGGKNKEVAATNSLTANRELETVGAIDVSDL